MTMQSTSSKATTLDRSTQIASSSIRGGKYTSDLYWWSTELRLHRDGDFFLYVTGGAATEAHRYSLRWINRAEAKRWILNNATEAVTGWGYSDDQAERLLNSEDVPQDEVRETCIDNEDLWESLEEQVF